MFVAQYYLEPSMAVQEKRECGDRIMLVDDSTKTKLFFTFQNDATAQELVL